MDKLKEKATVTMGLAYDETPMLGNQIKFGLISKVVPETLPFRIEVGGVTISIKCLEYSPNEHNVDGACFDITAEIVHVHVVENDEFDGAPSNPDEWDEYIYETA